jgi:hypothetical protein
MTGPRDYLLNDVLPHEVNHTILAHFFKKPLPRWADEGASVCAESPATRAKMQKECIGLLNSGKAISLAWLFKLYDYPKDGQQMMSLYIQGHSVTAYLVGLKDHATFIEFVGLAMRDGWDKSAQATYGFADVEALQSAWVTSLRRLAEAKWKEETAKANPLGACGCSEPCAVACGCGCQGEEPSSPGVWVCWLLVATVVFAALVILVTRGR